MKNYWKVILIALVSFLVMLIIAPLRGGYVKIGEFTGIPMSMLVYFVAYFILTFFILKKYGRSIKPWILVIALLIGMSILDFSRVAPAFFRSSLFSLPDWGARILAILTGAWFYKTRNKTGRFLIAAATAVFAWLYCFPGFGWWMENYPRTEMAPLPTRVELYQPDRTVIDVFDIDKEYVVLFLWKADCRKCVKQFPRLQQMYDTHKDKDSIGIYAVYCGDPNSGSNPQMIAEKGYSGPCLSMDPKNELLKVLNIEKYPQVLLFYRGDVILIGTLKHMDRIFKRMDKKAQL